MQTIVMTGGTSGLGEVTARQLGSILDVQLILGGRETALPLDLASLESVRRFAGQVLATLGQTPINSLVLNAGLSFPKTARTVDGYETTFATNHLGHYLLLRLLTQALAPDAIVVITTSNTHDPRFSPVAPFAQVDARHLAQLLPEPGVFEAGFRAYATSKLCNLLTARAFAANADGIRVIAYNPGFIPGTGLGRNLPTAALPVANPEVAQAMRARAGSVLADLALGNMTPPPGQVYASLEQGELVWPSPSTLALRDEVAQQLWHDSAALVGL
ncbi:MAG: hypothetical protein GAK37_02410 [Pseudomonas sp.]|nr:MAG: hypothetical protein GAK37_02410 [Pseudomonas sp.]